MSTESDTLECPPSETSKSLTGRVWLSPAMLPFGDSVTFKDSSFFSSRAELPSPSEVRMAAGDVRRRYPPPVVFRSMNLLVKYGKLGSYAEAQCLWAIKRFLPEIPVPEVYGWCQDGEEVFIYMELVQGVTLEQLERAGKALRLRAVEANGGGSCKV
jgi:hypothetical protein